MKKFLKKALYLLKRDLITNSSYRFSFFFDFISIATSVTTFFFIAKIVGKGAEQYLSEFGGNYFSFVLIGLAFSGYLFATLGSFSQILANEQAEGTIEVWLISPTSLLTLLLCGAFVNFLLTTLRVAVYLAFGWLVFGFDMSKINLISTLFTLALMIIAFSSLGLLSASFLLVFKRGNPINWAVGGVSRLLGGIYFPVKVLPVYLQKISSFLPITYAISALRKSIMMNFSLSKLIPELTILALFAVLLFPLGMLSFRLALNKAKKNGSLLST